jgi:hypothetical protein
MDRGMDILMIEGVSKSDTYIYLDSDVGFCPLQSDIGGSDIRLSPRTFITHIELNVFLKVDCSNILPQPQWLGTPLKVSHTTCLAWLGSTRPDLSVDPKSQIFSTSKLTQIHITSKKNTNSTEITYTATHNFTFELNPG